MSALNIAVLTVSDSRDRASDASGNYLADAVQQAGHRLADQTILPDDRYALRAQVSAWIADPEVVVILTTGGTGITGRDVTPEAVSVLFDKPIEGFGELFRQESIAEIGAATVQSRCVAGVANGTLIFCLPGSSAAVRLAWEAILRPQLNATTRPCNFAMLLPRLKEV